MQIFFILNEMVIYSPLFFSSFWLNYRYSLGFWSYTSWTRYSLPIVIGRKQFHSLVLYRICSCSFYFWTFISKLTYRNRKKNELFRWRLLFSPNLILSSTLSVYFWVYNKAMGTLLCLLMWHKKNLKNLFNSWYHI